LLKIFLDDIDQNVEHTYYLVTELISIFSYVHNVAYIPVGSSSDNYRGDLQLRDPGITRKKMLNFDLQGVSLVGDWIIFNYPHIITNEQSLLVRLYRKARTAEYFDDSASFLFYYHIIDYPYNNQQNCAEEYIDNFVAQKQPSHVIDLINEVNKDRVFEKEKKDSPLGTYLKFFVRDSIAHIVRNPRNAIKAHNLNIDCFNQSKHLSNLNPLMREIARNKMMYKHEFNIQCESDILQITIA